MISYTVSDPPTLRADGGLVLIGGERAEDARLAATAPEAPRHNPDMRLGGLVAPAFRPLVDVLRDHEDTVIAIRTDLAVVSTHRVRCEMDYTTPVETSVPVSRNQLRTENELTTVDNLKAATVDFRHGPVTGLFRIGHLPLATVTAELTPHVAGHGRAATFEQAERVALFEAIERFNGMCPRN